MYNIEKRKANMHEKKLKKSDRSISKNLIKNKNFLMICSWVPAHLNFTKWFHQKSSFLTSKTSPPTQDKNWIYEFQFSSIEIAVDITKGRTEIDYFFIKDPDGILVEIVQDDRGLWYFRTLIYCLRFLEVLLLSTWQMTN